MKRAEWIFTNDDAEEIAAHHAKHLSDFINREKLSARSGYEKSGKFAFKSFIIADGIDFDKIISALKPKIILETNIEKI